MPRVKQSKPKHIPSETMSTDPAVPVTEASVFAPGVADASESPAAGKAVELEVKPSPKKPRVVKPRPCQRCEERRARERQYAKSSRLRQRLATSPAPPTTPADGAAVAPAAAEAGAPDAATQAS